MFVHNYISSLILDDMSETFVLHFSKDNFDEWRFEM